MGKYPPPEYYGLPSRFSDWREGQFEAIQNSLASKKRIVGQAAPTGTGKSMLLMGEAVMAEGRRIILTSTKPLQGQYEEQFGTLLTDIRGQQNYVCTALQPGGEHYAPYIPLGATVDEGPCHYGQKCSLALGGCSYYDRLRQAKYSSLVSTNYDLFLAVNKYSEGIGLFNFMACDEAHEIPEKLAAIMAAEVTAKEARNVLHQELFPSSDPLYWGNWANKNKYRVVREIESYKESGTETPEARYRLKALTRTLRSLNQMGEATEDWVVEITGDKVRVEPIWPKQFVEDYLLRGTNKIVFASATIRPKTFSLLGLEDFDFFEYQSPFSIARRPVHYVPVVKMRYDMDYEDKVRMVRAVDQIIARRLDRKIIIPTTSFAFQKFLLGHSRFAQYMVTNSRTAEGRSNTEQVIEVFKGAPPPAVLVSPSISTGVDFPYTQCETVIIVKVPFPDTSSRIYRARVAIDSEYGPYIAAQTIVQMAGRGMRAEDDRCETIILDASFGSLKSQYPHLFPLWFLTAVRKSDTLPTPLEKLQEKI